MSDKVEITKEDRIRNSLLKVESVIYNMIGGIPKIRFKVEFSKFDFIVFNKNNFKLEIIGVVGNYTIFHQSIQDLICNLEYMYLEMDDEKEIERHFNAWNSDLYIDDSDIVEEPTVVDFSYDTKLTKEERDRDMIGYERIMKVKENTTI